MECCENKNINNEKICINCGVIHGYKYVHEDVFIDFNMNISNMLYYKQSIYRRKKIYIKMFAYKRHIMTYCYFLIKV